MRLSRLLCAALAAVVLVPHQLFAEPVSLTYWVRVSERHDLTPPPSQWGWVPIDPVVFQLRLTFDTGVTERRQGDTYALTFFGSAAMTDVPLSGAGVTTGIPVGRTWISNFWESGEQAAYAVAGIESSSPGVSSGSARGVQLFTFDLSPRLAPGESGTLATYLTAMRSAELRFRFYD